MIYPAPFEDVQGGPFGVVLADPPWSYENGGGQGPARFHNYGGPPRLNGSAYAKYDLMSTADICGLPISSLASTDSVLLLWATWPCLTDALRAIDAWGFSYITGFPWIKLTEPPWCDLWGAEHIKPTYGTGYWVRGCSEPLLICRRGKPAIPTIGACGLLAERMEHSRKPDDIYEYAEALEGPRIELFARRTRPGWTSWGNEVHAK